MDNANHNIKSYWDKYKSSNHASTFDALNTWVAENTTAINQRRIRRNNRKFFLLAVPALFVMLTAFRTKSIENSGNVFSLEIDTSHVKSVADIDVIARSLKHNLLKYYNRRGFIQVIGLIEVNEYNYQQEILSFKNLPGVVAFDIIPIQTQVSESLLSRFIFLFSKKHIDRKPIGEKEAAKKVNDQLRQKGITEVVLATDGERMILKADTEIDTLFYSNKGSTNLVDSFFKIPVDPKGKKTIDSVRDTIIGLPNEFEFIKLWNQEDSFTQNENEAIKKIKDLNISQIKFYAHEWRSVQDLNNFFEKNNLELAAFEDGSVNIKRKAGRFLLKSGLAKLVLIIKNKRYYYVCDENNERIKSYYEEVLGINQHNK